MSYRIKKILRGFLQFATLAGLVFGVFAIEQVDQEIQDRGLTQLRNQGEAPSWAKERRIVPETAINEDDEHVAAR